MAETTTISQTPLRTAAAANRWRTEDWIAVVLGFLVITAVLAVFQWKVADLRNIMPTFRWTTDAQIASMTPRWIDALESVRQDAAAKNRTNVVALGNALKDALTGQ